jgi:putative DNA primase/helicase
VKDETEDASALFNRAIEELLPLPPGSDTDLGDIFARLYGHNWRYVELWKSWMWWNGSRWERDVILRIRDTVKEMMIHYVEHGAGSLLTDAQKKTQLNNATISNVIAAASSHPLLRATVEQWDLDQWIVNTPTGTLSLIDGTLSQHARQHYCTTSTIVHPKGDCPLWMSHLETITGGDLDLQSYLKRAAGYSLTGVTSEHVFFFCYGAGGNGKSVFLDTISAIMGKYAKQANIDMFLKSRGEQPQHEIADLVGARYVTVNEVKKGRSFDESRINNLTSAKSITTCRKYEHPFEFTPRLKLWFAGNEKPEISGGVDQAIRRRVQIIPFRYTIDETKKLKNFPELLVAEYPGILQWMIDGCREWQRIGLSPPEVVTSATNDYLDNEDIFASWLNECCVLDPPASATLSDVYENYKIHCKMCDETPLKRSKMIEALKGHGVTVASYYGLKHCEGMRLKL